MREIVFNKLGTSVKITQSLRRNNINVFLKEVYYKLDLDYPKFFKMDNLCKLGIIGIELLYRKNKDLFSRKDRVGIILQNKSSSLDSDIKHQEEIENNTVSPAVFVYTLPNIVIGEISIKHKWQSEGVFFVDEDIDYELLSQYSNILLKENRTDLNIIGWIDILKDHLSLRMCIVDEEIDDEELNNLLD
ncbi:MAG: 3-oxoacyl-ACP synthase [Flavobacteriales bacterium]|nr:3-oxoacyl-ACP synthase [Flavobacteriales bacterium]